MSATLSRTRSHLIMMMKAVSVQNTAKAMKPFKSLRIFKIHQNYKKLRTFKYVVMLICIIRLIHVNLVVKINTSKNNSRK